MVLLAKAAFSPRSSKRYAPIPAAWRRVRKTLAYEVDSASDPHIESHSEVCCGGTVSSCVTVIAGIPLKANLKAVGVKSS